MVNFFVGEDLVMWQPNRVGGHAELAAEVATVGNRYPKFARNAPVRIS